jgi:phosphatidate cytidylyltransferase
VKTRVLVALAGIPLVLAAVFLAGPRLFGAIVLVVALAALLEYVALCGIEKPLAAALLICAAAVLAAVPADRAPAAAAAAFCALALFSLRGVVDPARRFQGLAEGILGLAYIAYAMGCLWLLRTRIADGAAWVFLILAATWAGDSAAYFVGTRYGRRKIAPALSPNKTLAGACGGLAGSLAGGLVALPLFDGGAPSASAVAAVALAVGVSGQLGDLFESLWKRAKGVKDSGRLIPGHGGILDRIDSLLLAFPVGYHLVRAWSPW